MDQSVNKKRMLRARVLEYARNHAVQNRIPTVRELCRGMNVSKYMLLNCMNDLIREGILYRKSRKEGTYLANSPGRKVIGLLMNGFSFRNDYLEQPPWLSGFCKAFMDKEHFFIRLLSLSPNSSLEDLIRQYDLKAVVICLRRDPEEIPLGKLSEEVLRKTIFSFYEFDTSPAGLSPFNTLLPDREFWCREYVREAFRRGCKRFVLLGDDDFVNEAMIDEMEKLGMEWSKDCRISSTARVKQSLDKLLEQYPVDAIRCGGGYEVYLADYLRATPSFRPFLPLLDHARAQEYFKEITPAVPCAVLFESLGSFRERLGMECGLRAITLAQTGEVFPTERLQMHYRNEFLHTERCLKTAEKRKETA